MKLADTYLARACADGETSTKIGLEATHALRGTLNTSSVLVLIVCRQLQIPWTRQPFGHGTPTSLSHSAPVFPH